MAKLLATILIAANKGMQGPVVHPLLYLVDVDATSPDVRMHVEIHVERRVPPLAQTAHEKCYVTEFRAVARFEVVDKAGVFAHWRVAAPTCDVGRAVLGHMLFECQYCSSVLFCFKGTHDVVVAFVMRLKATLSTNVTMLQMEL